MFGPSGYGKALGDLFGKAAGTIREGVSRSARREEEGQAAAREESFTRDVVDALEGPIREGIRSIEEHFPGVETKIEFHSHGLPTGEEAEIGADLGIRVIFQTAQFSLAKAVLVQCKRMSGKPPNFRFDKMRGDGERQAREMLKITPASFFMMFNHGSQADLLQISGIPASLVCPLQPDALDAKRADIGRNCPNWEMSAGTLWDMGVAMVPANRVLGLSVSSKTSNTPFPTDARTMLSAALPLGVFITDLFAPCFVGDPRRSVVRIATPPKYREELIGLAGLDDGEFADFAVRKSIDIWIKQVS